MYEYYPLDPTCVERGTVSEEPTRNRTALPYDYVLLLGIQDTPVGRRLSNCRLLESSRRQSSCAHVIL